MGAPVRSYGGKNSSSSSKSSSSTSTTKKSSSRASGILGSGRTSRRSGGLSDSMAEAFDKLTEIGELKNNVSEAETNLAEAEEALNTAVDKFLQSIAGHQAKESLRDLLTNILTNDEDRGDDGIEI